MSSAQTAFQRLALVNAVALALASHAAAQNNAAGEGAVLELAPSTVTSESIVRDAVVDVITASDIEDNQVDNFDDLVKFIPGVSVSRGDDRWGASGFNIRGLDEDRVAINVDGVPQGETLKYEDGQAYGYFKGSRNGVDLDALKAVEIVKGADAILSGSGSLAGAVNMTTKDPDDLLASVGDDWAFHIKSSYAGSNDEVGNTISVANRTGKLESLLIYTRRDAHEFENHDGSGLDIDGAGREVPDPQDSELNSVLAKLIYEINPGNEIGLVTSYYDLDRNTDQRSFNGDWYLDRQGHDVSETKRVGIFHELTQETALFDRISTALNRQEGGFDARTSQRVDIQIPNFPAFNTLEDRVDIRSFDQDILQFTMDLEKSLGSHRLLYGFEWQDKEFHNSQFRQSDNLKNDDQNWETTNIGALIPQAEAEVATLYALDTVGFGNSTQLRLGLRYDNYAYDAKGDSNFADTTGTLSGVDFSAVTWTLGVEQALTETLSLEAGVSTGFRAPTIEDMYSTSGSVDDWSVVANPDLEAEYSTNYDIALVGEYGVGSYRIGAFFSQYKDFIDYESREGINPNTGLPDPNGWRVPTNSNEVDMKGLEFSAALDLSEVLRVAPGLSTRLQAAYTDGEEADGDPVYTIQPLNVVWSLGYTPGEWGVNMLASYTKGKSRSDSYNTNSSGGRDYPLYLSDTVTVFDVVGHYYLLDNLRLTAGIYNLTDEEYYTWDSVRFIDQGDLRPGIGVIDNGIRRYSEPGRNYEVSVSFMF